MPPDQHRAEVERLIAHPTAGNLPVAQVPATTACWTRPASPDLASAAPRSTIYAVVDEAILYMTGERDEIGFKDCDHDDIAESVTQSVMLALEGRHPQVRG